VIAAKDEENNIQSRLMNLVNQTYPADKYEILIVSDGSVDNTNQYVLDYIKVLSDSIDIHPSIRLITLDKNSGKPTAINKGISCSGGDIVVFSDARQQFDNDAIEQLVSNFTDPRVGAVSGELFFRESLDSNVQMQMGLYWKYEKAIRRSEAIVSSVIGATGAIYAIRKELFEPINADTLLDDVLIPMSIVLKGYRVVFDDKARAYDIVSKSSTQEWRRKVRTLAGNWQLINLMPSLYSPFMNPVFIQFVSHKVFRTVIPFCLPIVFIMSFMLDGWFYELLALVQIVTYGAVLIAHYIESLRDNKLIGFAYFFIVMNLAAITGFWIWITGRCDSIWKPAYKEK